MVVPHFAVVVAAAVGVDVEAHEEEEVLCELEYRHKRLERCHWAFVCDLAPHCLQTVS